MKNIKCTAGVLTELMYLLSRFIRDSGLSEFILDGLEDGVDIDVGAMRLILETSSELKKVCIRNTSWTQSEDCSELLCGLLA